jgi:hypothetical protein
LDLDLDIDLDIDLMDLLGLVLGRDKVRYIEVGLDLDMDLDFDKDLGFDKRMDLGSGVMDKFG